MIPDYCEAITAYRCWNVFPDGLMVGQAHSEPWPMFQPFVGRCGYVSGSGHVKAGVWVPPPVLDCDCGVHALKQLEYAEARLIEEHTQTYNSFSVRFYVGDRRPPEGRVWGAVKLWGRVIEHDYGYRAEFAYPSALFCENEKLARIVAALYGVPCEVKKLTYPKPENVWSDGYTSKWVTIGNTLPAPSPYQLLPTTQAGVVQPASITQVKALGHSKYQRKAAAVAAAQKEEAAAKKRDLIQQYLAKGASDLSVKV